MVQYPIPHLRVFPRPTRAPVPALGPGLVDTRVRSLVTQGPVPPAKSPSSSHVFAESKSCPSAVPILRPAAQGSLQVHRVGQLVARSLAVVITRANLYVMMGLALPVL